MYSLDPTLQFMTLPPANRLTATVYRQHGLPPLKMLDNSRKMPANSVVGMFLNKLSRPNLTSLKRNTKSPGREI